MYFQAKYCTVANKSFQKVTSLQNKTAFWIVAIVSPSVKISKYSFLFYWQTFLLLGTAYGKGVYFAVKLRLSLKYTSASSGIGHMFLATVEVGASCQGYRNMPVLPSREECASHITYDSACDDPDDPSMFVIFNDIQAYPSYHVTFRYHNW